MNGRGFVNGTYGSGKTPCQVYYVERHGGVWYAVGDSRNVNFYPGSLEEGVDVEYLRDTDFFTANKGIEDEFHLEEEVDDYLNG